MKTSSSSKKRNRVWPILTLITLSAITAGSTSFADNHSSTTEKDERRFIQVEAPGRDARSALAAAGMSIEAIRSDSVWGFVDKTSFELIRKRGFKVLGVHDFQTGRGGHDNMFKAFPGGDERFHDVTEAKALFSELHAKNKDITRIGTIGKSVQGRDIIAININSEPQSLKRGRSNKPGFVILGAHHAREHLSTEIPLMFAKYLLDNRENPQVGALLKSRDIWIIPIVNPDGKEHDIARGRYEMWRKNRRDNGNGTFGVDLNRNYGFKWGTGGSSNSTSSETYMGPEPFSEPETRTVKSFVEAHDNIKVLLSVHTFSELILFPWGHTYDDIGNARDLAVFKKMASTMAQWNRYTPQQASDLYIASGDTTDWAYGERGIFSFTFELSPKSMFQGGFYPGASVIDKVFADNLKPLLYMLDVSDDPYRVLEARGSDRSSRSSNLLRNYVQPDLAPETYWETLPLPQMTRY